ncbi:putative uracil permease [Sistotremastrum niveocremeum HHB9708]|uniref:Putative uracil permease n=1 Tax=Sistotremastrum niveocremeum HHB9708 TaxID=1314777 RepID=A0A164RN71_9AGAM|nr:putative uracil permease [Sistotremastrum niveocremeum HHB9708]
MEYRGPARRSAQSSWSAPPFRSWVLKIFSLSSNRKENVAYLPLPPTDKESVYLAASVPQEEDQSFSVFSSQPSPDSSDDMGAFSRFISLIEVDHPKGLTHSELFLSNEDLLPVPPEKRAWKAWNFVTFWIADSFNINTWMIVSSMIQIGLSWWQAWICVWLGYGVVAPFIVLNARPGAMHHITFPVVARQSFGLWGSLWCTFNRGVMACIWYGVQASIGGSCVLVMLRAMWPSVNNIPNHLPESAGITTRDFMAFFLFWLISLPAIWFPIHKIRHLFTAKAIFVPIAGITFFIWSIVKAKGVGPIIHQPSQIHGAELGWAMVSSLMSCVSNMATLVTNAPDFASRARKPRDAVWTQLLSVPIAFSLVSFIGIIVSSSSQVIYGEAIWSPIDLLGKLLDGEPSHATRFGVWFISAAFILAQLGTNISANSISAGCDLTSLFPRFINIRRGGYIAAIIGLAMCPWQLLKSSNSFTSYLSAYSVFLSSIAGVMITEYYIVKKGRVRVSDLYTSRSDGWYYYTYGVNLRAYAAYISGILINVVGFAGATGRTVPIAATHIYQMSFFTGFGVSSLVYYLLHVFFPAQPGRVKGWEEVDVSEWKGLGVEHERHSEDGDSQSDEKEKERTASDVEVNVYKGH